MHVSRRQTHLQPVLKLPTWLCKLMAGRSAEEPSELMMLEIMEATGKAVAASWFSLYMSTVEVREVGSDRASGQAK